LPKTATDILKRMNSELIVTYQKAMTALDREVVFYTKKGDLTSALAIKDQIDDLKQQVDNLQQGAKHTDEGTRVAPDLLIINVVYGVDGRDTDVTEKVCSALIEKQAAVCGNGLLGNPVPNVVKRAIFEYKLRDRKLKRSYRQETVVTLDMLRGPEKK
jgi:hypothetical protein